MADPKPDILYALGQIYDLAVTADDEGNGSDEIDAIMRICEEHLPEKPELEPPEPSILYAQRPAGSRKHMGEAYTLDAAAEAIADWQEDGTWPRNCLPILVEPDGTELGFEEGEWVLHIEE